MLKPGEMIGSYRLDKIIGSGSSASVYLAYSLHMQKLVAIKLRFCTQSQHESLLSARFKESARLHSHFCHPNITWLFEAIETDLYQALILEYLPGGTLSQFLKQRGQLNVDEACLIGAHLADGLEHMHDIQVIHRDIKPDNILFMETNELSSIRIADFDVSKNPYHSPNLTEKGAHVGTLSYIAPEQFDHDKPRAIADIYSLGIVLFESIAGRLPYDSVNMSSIFNYFLDHKPFPKLSSFHAGVSPSLDWIIEQALCHDASRRIPSAATFALLLLAASPSSQASFQRLREIKLQTRMDWLTQALTWAPQEVKSDLSHKLNQMGVTL